MHSAVLTDDGAESTCCNCNCNSLLAHRRRRHRVQSYDAVDERTSERSAAFPTCLIRELARR